MTRRMAFTLGALAALALGLLASYLLGKLEPYQEEIDHGPAPEAQQDPYLAAERFLTALEVPVSRQEGVRPPESASAQTLLLLGDRTAMTATQTDRVLAWVEHGGHLVFVAEQLWNEDKGESGDLLLDRLGLQQYESDDDATHATDEQPEAATTGTERFPELTRLYIDGESAPAYLAFDTRFHLYDASKRAYAWANSASATHMLQLAHGNGTVTALTDAWIWRNDRIGDYDHAWLLWYLTQGSSVTLAYQRDPDNLLQQIVEHFPETVVALTLVLGLTLWHLALRRGPVLPAATPARRQLLEHLRGTSAFLFRRGLQAHLIETLQQDVIRRAERRHPGFERLPGQARRDALARISGLPAECVTHAMHTTGRPSGPVEFTRKVAQLQRLRNAL